MCPLASEAGERTPPVPKGRGGARSPHRPDGSQPASRLRGPRVSGSQLLTTLVVALCLVLFVFPVVMLAQGAFAEGQPSSRGGWTLDPFREVYGSAGVGKVVWNSTLLATIVTLVGKSLSFYFAWLVARTDTPLRRWITPTMLVVLTIPTLFFGISWGLLGNQHSGLINTELDSWTGGILPTINIESFGGLVFVATLKSVAFGYFLLLGPMYAMNRSLEEAASVAGASQKRIFFGVDVPVLAPALISALVLGFILGLEYFELPLLLASPAGVDVVSTEIYNYLNDSTPPRYAEASALALVVVLALISLLVVQRRALDMRDFRTVVGKSTMNEPWKLGRWRYAGTVAFLIYAALAVVLPLIELTRTALLPYIGAEDGHSLRNFELLFEKPQMLEALRNTALLATLGGFVVMTLALGIVYVIRRARPVWLGRFISRTTWLPWAAPGTALALGILWVVLTVPVARNLYGGMALMLIGLVIVAMPLAMRSVESAIEQVSDELEQAAWVAGAGRLRAYGDISVRLILPSFASGWLLTGIHISGNLVMPLMIGSTTMRTVPKETYDLYSTGQAPQAAAFACVVLGGLLGVYLVAVILRLVLARALMQQRWRPNTATQSEVGPNTGESANRQRVVAGGGDSPSLGEDDV